MVALIAVTFSALKGTAIAVAAVNAAVLAAALVCMYILRRLNSGENSGEEGRTAPDAAGASHGPETELLGLLEVKIPLFEREENPSPKKSIAKALPKREEGISRHARREEILPSNGDCEPYLQPSAEGENVRERYLKEIKLNKIS